LSGGATSGCECDEYPFNSTWNGAFSDRDTTPRTSSARYINGLQNGKAGTRLQQFYQAERVLDFTIDPGIPYIRDNQSVSIPLSNFGDNFWVHVE
jgi:hypothetical protein